MTNQKGDGDHVMVDPEILRDCPGCGGRRIDMYCYYKTSLAFHYVDLDNVRYGVQCKDCGEGSTWFKDAAKAVAAWNLKPEGEE